MSKEVIRKIINYNIRKLILKLVVKLLALVLLLLFMVISTILIINNISIINIISVFVRPTFIQCPNVKGYLTVGPKGLAHRVPRPLKQPKVPQLQGILKNQCPNSPFFSPQNLC